MVHPLQLINKKAPPERAALFCAWGLDRSGKWELAKSQPFPIPDSPFPSQPLQAAAQATSDGSKILMVLDVGNTRLIGLGPRLRLGRIAGRPQVLRAEAERALPRQVPGHAEIDAGPATFGPQEIVRCAGPRLYHAADDAAADRATV